MTKGEIKGLQDLAMAHGGSLTINPDTGLVEASFLKNLLPVIAGAGLSFMFPGSAALIGLGVGGLETARTGDIGRGLMAGLGAYGGAGLAGGLSAAATPAAGASTGISAGASAAPAAATSTAPTALGSTANMANASNTLAGSSLAGPGTSSFGISATPGASSTLGGISAPAGGSFTTAAPGMTNAQIAKYGMAAASPILNDALTPKTVMPELEEDDGPNKGKYLSPNFQGYDPRRPNPYYRPTGLGYAAGGMIDPMQQMPNGGLAALQGMRDGYGASQTMDGNIPQMAGGGEIGGYSDGGRMLKGPGDGMSDSIPGVIGNKQPARLADGEFVIPADVVSHLGNGSTDAGAKRLYSMMDQVRKARTGTKKQGKQIKAEKYLPTKKMAEGGMTAPTTSSSSIVSPEALMGLGDLSALGSMISNTRGPAAVYTPPTYSPAEAQVAATTAARPVSEPVTFKQYQETPETPEITSRKLFRIGYGQRPYDEFNDPGGA
jgi:hypothetical protein